MKPTSRSEKNWARFKIIILALFVVLALLSIRFTRVGELFSPGVLRTYVDAAGLWAPLAFILFYSTGVCLFVPGTLLTGIGAAIFGPYLGFVYVWLGAMVGSSAAFFIGRTLGRDFTASLVGERLKRFDEAIARNGFAAVLYLRLIYFPFSVMNFGMGLTAVRFLDYFLGTALGILAGTFIFTFFIGNLVEIWTTGNWGQLISYKVFFSIALFVLSLFIPKAVKKIRGEP